jgi:hypothetical protein
MKDKGLSRNCFGKCRKDYETYKMGNKVARRKGDKVDLTFQTFYNAGYNITVFSLFAFSPYNLLNMSTY